MHKLARRADAPEPRPARPVPRLGLGRQHALVAGEARADGAHEEDRRAEAVAAEMEPVFDAVFERRAVQEGEVDVQVAEERLDELRHQCCAGEGVRGVWRFWTDQQLA